MKVAIVNDTRPQKHIGCTLVMDAFEHLCADYGWQLLGAVRRSENWRHHRPLLAAADLVILNGEGTLHHSRPHAMDMLRLAVEYPAVLVNSVWQANDKYKTWLQPFLFVAWRESLSACDAGCGEVVPDMTFYHEDLGAFDSNGPVLIGDRVSVQPEPNMLSAHDPDYMAKVRLGRAIATGRFHGVCIAARMGMPFAAYPSNTHKVEGIMIDMGVPELFTADWRPALERVPTGLPDSVRRYAETARNRIRAMAEEIQRSLR